MTVQDIPNFVNALGNGVQTSFAFNFRADDVSWVTVSFATDLIGVTLNLDQDTSPGGTVDYSVAPPNLQAILISRVTPQVQSMDYTRYGPFDSESHEDQLDKLMMITQDLAQKFEDITFLGTVDDSILRYDAASASYVEFGPGAGEFFLPTADGAAGQILSTDGAGQLNWATIVGGIVFPFAIPDGDQILWGTDGDVEQYYDNALNALIFNRNAPGGTDFRVNMPNLRVNALANSVTAVTIGETVTLRGDNQNAIINMYGEEGGAFNFTQLTEFGNSFRILANHEIELQAVGFPLRLEGMTILVEQRAAPLADVAGYGQFWVDDTSDGRPMFTDAAGVTTAIISTPLPGSIEGSMLRYFTASSSYLEFGDDPGEFLLPALDGTIGQVMSTDGAGQLSWTTISGGIVFPLTILDGDQIIWGTGGDVEQSYDNALNALVFQRIAPGGTDFRVNMPNLRVNALANSTTAVTIGETVTLRGNNQNAIINMYGEEGGAFSFTQLTEFGDSFRIFTSHEIELQAIGFGLRLEGMVMFMEQRAAAQADQAGYGQFWVDNTGNGRPMFTDAAGVDTVLN